MTNEHTCGAAPSAGEAASYLVRVGYEVRGCVNSMLGIAELLRDTALTSEQREYVDILRTSADRLLSVTGDIVELATGSGEVHPTAVMEFDLAELLDQMIEVLSPLAAEAGVRLSLSTDPKLHGYVLGDRQRLEEVLVTLINSGLRAAVPGVVTIAALTSVGHAVRFRIAVPAPRRESEPSADVALALARRGITALGGQLHVERSAGDSVFDFELPLPRAAAGPGEPVVAGPARVLLAEDSEDNRFVIRAYLKNQPYHLDAVSTGREAVHFVQAAAYDVILMDLEMPDVGGIEAVRQIRSLELAMDRKPAPIIALTAHTGSDGVARCLAAGFSGYVSKPVDRKTILAALEQYARRC